MNAVAFVELSAPRGALGAILTATLPTVSGELRTSSEILSKVQGRLRDLAERARWLGLVPAANAIARGQATVFQDADRLDQALAELLCADLSPPAAAVAAQALGDMSAELLALQDEDLERGALEYLELLDEAADSRALADLMKDIEHAAATVRRLAEQLDGARSRIHGALLVEAEGLEGSEAVAAAETVAAASRTEGARP